MKLLQAASSMVLDVQPIIIDPTCLSKEAASVLLALIQSRPGMPDSVQLIPNKPYEVNINNRVVSIYVTHEIVARKVILPNGKETIRYSVISNQAADILGKGAFGEVVRLAGTLKVSAKNELVFRADKQRAVKIEYLPNERKCNNVKMEAELLQMYPDFHGKNITIVSDENGKPQKSYIVFNEYPGCNLKSIVDKEVYALQMTVRQRFDITIAILHDLQALHAHGLLHRDLKPANIMAEIRRSTAKIIDLGLGRKTANPDGRDVGNLVYKAPEAIAFGMNNEPADVYGMGLLICKLWKGGSRNSQEEYENAVMNSEERFIPTFEFANLDKQEINDFRHVISTMLIRNPNERAKLQEVIQQIEMISLRYQVKLAAWMDVKTVQAMHHAYTVAVDAREAIQAIQIQLNQSQPDILKEVLNEVIAKIEDTPEAIRCFTKFLRVNAFMGITKRADLFNKVNYVVDEYELRLKLMNQYKTFFTKFDELVFSDYPAFEVWDCYLEAEELLVEVDAALMKTNKSKRELTFDVLAELVTKFDKCIADLSVLTQKVDALPACEEIKSLITEFGLFAISSSTKQPAAETVNVLMPSVDLS